MTAGEMPGDITAYAEAQAAAAPPLTAEQCDRLQALLEQGNCVRSNSAAAGPIGAVK